MLVSFVSIGLFMTIIGLIVYGMHKKETDDDKNNAKKKLMYISVSPIAIIFVLLIIAALLSYRGV